MRHLRPLVVLSALLTAVLAGCTDDGTGGDDAVVPPSLEPQFSEDRGRGNITVDQVSLPLDPPLPGERGLATAPTLRLGEWWTIRLTEHFAGTQYEITRVVAGTEHGNYLVGFPLDAFSNDALVMHMPGYGDILSDLSYGAHDVPFVPVSFPLEPGKTWTTAWEAETATMEMVVDEITPEGVAIITGVPTPDSGAYPTTIEYDPAIGEVRKLVMQGYAEYEVIDHGYGYEGDVRVPHAHDLVFLNGRIAAVGDIAAPLVPPSPAAPTETITVGEGYDRLSFGALFFDIAAATMQDQAGSSAAAGAYEIELTAPDGTVYAETFTPADGYWIKAVFYGHENPAGDWNLRAVAGGAGAAFVEGIGYHSIDIALPSGCVLRSAAANHHGTLCGDERASEGLAQ